jgi:hypothetical protein
MSVSDDIQAIIAIADKLPAPAIRAARLFAERVLRGETVNTALLKTAEILAAEATVPDP